MNPPPPSPVEWLLTISTQQCVDTMASAAEPPFFNVSTPISEHFLLSAATAAFSKTSGWAYAKFGCFPDAWTRLVPAK